MIRLFLDVLGEIPTRFGVVILAYAVMPNHFHLILESSEGQLSEAMRYLGAEYTQRLNRIQAWDGPVFRGRFRNRVIEQEAYLAYLFAYIHLNPVRAGIAVSAGACTWTSHRALVGMDGLPRWLSTTGLIHAFGTVDGYLRFLADVSNGRQAPPEGWVTKRLWVPTGEPRPRAPALLEPSVLLAEVAHVTGQPVERLLAPRARDNAARALAAWWLAQRSRRTVREVADWLGCSRTRASQLCSLAKTGDEPFPQWRAALLAFAPPAGLTGERPGLIYRTRPVRGTGVRTHKLVKHRNYPQRTVPRSRLAGDSQDEQTCSS